MPPPSVRPQRPGLRALVLGAAAVLVFVAAMLVSQAASDRLQTAATNEAVRTTSAVVHGYVDPLVADGGLTGQTPADAAAIDAELTRLVGSRQILRVKIWSADGVVLYSDLPSLIGQRFPVDDSLSDALAGEVATDYSDADEAENVFERGLANEFLSVYLPIEASGRVVGAYEIYEDAAPIVAEVDAARQDVFLIAGGMAIALFGLLWLAFSGASRLLARRAVQLRRSEERFRSLVANSVDVNVIVAPDGTVRYESPAAERVVGYAASDLSQRALVDMFHPDDRSYAQQLLSEVTRAPGTQVTGELRARHADGSFPFVEVVLKNLLGDPAVDGIVVNYRDISARRRLEEELRHQAFHDRLTGLANRALFSDRLEHALSRRRRFEAPIAVLFIDVDDFKTVNDSLGHSAGDRLLEAVAARLALVGRSGDTIARMGGDEFAVLMEDAPDPDAAVRFGLRILAALAPTFNDAAGELFVHASVGVATSSTSATAEDLLRNADVAMYAAKTAGGNRVELFQASMHTAALARLALKADLEHALDRNEFRLVYQPIVDVRTGDPVGVEALLRWQHPVRGTVAPDEFLHLAESTGLIVPLGRWVLGEALRQLGAWDSLGGRRLRMSVNVSARQLQDGSFVDDVDAALRDAAVDPGRVTLELTESVLMADADAAVLVLRALKRLGVRLAIDDFGTGYSSLSYLQRFPIDQLKIDRSFVAAMADSAEQAAVVMSVVRLGEALHVATVAEGIERESQLRAIRDLGADFGQGYLFARPLPADEIATLIATSASTVTSTSEAA